MAKDKLVGIKELAEELGVSESTIKEYKKLGMPHSAKGKGIATKYDVDACAAWMKANNKTGDIGRAPGEISEEMKRQQLRKTIAQADKYEQELKTAKMEFDIASSKLLKKEDVEQDRISKILYVKNGLLGFASSLSPQLEGLTTQEIQTKIEVEIMRLLEQFSRGE
jgi:phage terminase Nu1 subunit (DNA packaging protein)